MSFLFASSHLPETRVQRPDDLEDEEDDVQPMLHSGSVRAFSHLPQPVRAQADADSLWRSGIVPIPPRSATPTSPAPSRPGDLDDPPPPERALSHQLQRTGSEAPGTPPADGIAAAKASGVFDVVRQQFNRDDSPHFMDEDGNLRPRDQTRQQDSPAPRDARNPQFGAGAPPRPAWGTGHAAAADASSSRSPRAPSSASEDTRPWHAPAITPEDLDPQHFDDDDADGSHSAFKGGPGAHDLVYRIHGESQPKHEFQDLLYRFHGSPEEAKEHARSFSQNVADVYGSPPLLAAQGAALPQGESPRPAGNPAPPSSSQKTFQQLPPQKTTTSAPKQETETSKKAIPTTTVRIGNHPSFDNVNAPQKEIDEWNTAFRETYGQLAADAARKHGVPARLLAALSANEMAAPNWDAFHAFADRNFFTKSAGPLQISYQTALRYKLIPIDNEFYGATQADRWTALHDPDTRYGQSDPRTGLTPDQRLNYYRDNPYPGRHGDQIIHSYLDNPATSFDAGAKLLKIYLQRLVDDYKSGAYLKYSQDFRSLSGLSSSIDPIHKDLNILASGDKEAIVNLRISDSLARALAMMWNNGADIVNVRNIAELSPRAYAHGDNIWFQQKSQDDLIPRN